MPFPGSSRQVTLLLPAEREGWEVWECPPHGGSVHRGSVAAPADRRGGGAVVVGLPATRCLTLTFDFPVSGDAALARRMAFGQLEKRGLIPRGSTPEAAPFACHPVAVDGDAGAGTRVSVDVLSEELPNSLRVEGGRSFAAAFRLLPVPDERLLVAREHGRWVVAAAREGVLVYTHVLGDAERAVDELAADLRATALTLESRGWLRDGVQAIVLWADHEATSGAEALAERIGLPVEVAPRPAPSAALAREFVRQRHLLPKAVADRRRRRRGALVKAAAVVAAILGLVAVAKGFRDKLRTLEQRVAELEQELANSTGDADFVKRAGERWNSLRNVLEPKRYPVIHLDHLARLMPPEGVVMTGFDSKVSDVSFAGTAANAKLAYEYYNAIRSDGELAVYGWSMDRPALDDDGTASFTIKGKMR